MKCKQCGKKMNPVESMLGFICGKCVRENHKKSDWRNKKVTMKNYHQPKWTMD